MKKAIAAGLALFVAGAAQAVTFDAYKDVLEANILCKGKDISADFHKKFMTQSGFIAKAPMVKGGTSYKFLQKNTVYEMPVDAAILEDDAGSTVVGVTFDLPLTAVVQNLKKIGVAVPDPRELKAKASAGSFTPGWYVVGKNNKNPNKTDLYCAI